MFEGEPVEPLTNPEGNKSKKKLIIIISIVSVLVLAVIVGLVVFFVTRKSGDDSDKELKFISWAEAHEKAKEKLKQFTID